jgi:nucleotide-binding universal stress UspA family protein
MSGSEYDLYSGVAMQILMATGGAPHSEAALRFGAHLLNTGRTDRLPTILTVIRREADRPNAESILTHSIQLMGLEPSQVRSRIRVGQPAEEIVCEAEEGNYDLIILGEKPHHDFATRFLLGSTATRTVERSPCPVIIAKGKIEPIRRILLCDSGAQSSSLLNCFVEQLADLLKDEEEITVLHVMSQISAGPGVSGRQLRANAEELIKEHSPEGQLLEQDMQLLQRLNIHARPKVRHGLVVDEILQEAQEGNYNLLVIGAHCGGGWQRILLDDLTRQIITQVDRPVLVVR